MRVILCQSVFLRCLCFVLKVELHINWRNLSFLAKPPYPCQIKPVNFCKLVLKKSNYFKKLVKIKVKANTRYVVFWPFENLEITSILAARSKHFNNISISHDILCFIMCKYLSLYPGFLLFIFSNDLYLLIKTVKSAHDILL